MKKNQLFWVPIAFIAFLFFVLFPAIYEFRLSSIVTIVVYISLFFIADIEKEAALANLTKTLAIIISISLPFWIINTYFFELPVFNYLQYDVGKGDGQTTQLANYLIFIQPDNELVFRFYSVFDEPGVLGTLSSFVLFANKYNFKKWTNIIILIGGLFTFSLAFFFMLLAGVILLNILNLKAIMVVVIFLSVIGTSLYTLLKDDETFKSVILYRIENYDESGVESRTSDELNGFFKNYISSSEIFLGKGVNFFKERPNLLSGQGYKMFLIEYGIFGFAVVIMMYVSFFNGLSYINLLLLLIYVISFLQRPFMFTPWQLILFSMSVASLKRDRTKR